MKPFKVAGGFHGCGKGPGVMVSLVYARLVDVGGTAKGRRVAFQHQYALAFLSTEQSGIQAIESGPNDNLVILLTHIRKTFLLVRIARKLKKLNPAARKNKVSQLGNP